MFGALLERGCDGPTEQLDMRTLAERLFELGVSLMSSLLAHIVYLL